MAEETLVVYITGAREKGFTEETIRQRLLESGWDTEHIGEALAEVRRRQGGRRTGGKRPGGITAAAVVGMLLAGLFLLSAVQEASRFLATGDIGLRTFSEEEQMLLARYASQLNPLFFGFVLLSLAAGVLGLAAGGLLLRMRLGGLVFAVLLNALFVVLGILHPPFGIGVLAPFVMVAAVGLMAYLLERRKYFS